MDILVFVNHPFHNDPRVHRAVQFLGQQGYKITVASGILERPVPPPKDYEWGRVYYMRTFKAGRMTWLRSLVRFVAAPTQETQPSNSFTSAHIPVVSNAEKEGVGTLQTSDQSSSSKVVYLSLKQLFKSLAFFAQLLNFLQLNLRLIIRFYQLSVNLYYPNDIDVACAGAVLAWLHKKPLLYETHEFHTDQTTAHPAWYQRVILLLEGWVAKRAEHVIVVGDHIARLIRQQYNLKGLPKVIKSCPPYQSVAQPHPPSPPYKLLYHGMYQPKRGLEQIILAMHHIDMAHLYLRGLGYWEEPLRKLVEAERLVNKVTFLPPVSMQNLVKEAAPFDIGVGTFQDVNLSSRYCLPNKVFEYMMAGLALAVSNFPELQPLVDGYQVGITFDPSDPLDIARQINHLLANPDTLYQMQTQALKAAKETFNFEQEGLKLRKTVADIIGPPELNKL